MNQTSLQHTRFDADGWFFDAITLTLPWVLAQTLLSTRSSMMTACPLISGGGGAPVVRVAGAGQLR